MNNALPTTSPGQAARLAMLLDALDGVAISNAELASLTLTGRIRNQHHRERTSSANVPTVSGTRSKSYFNGLPLEHAQK